jgi:hypothetical protein
VPRLLACAPVAASAVLVLLSRSLTAVWMRRTILGPLDGDRLYGRPRGSGTSHSYVRAPQKPISGGSAVDTDSSKDNSRHLFTRGLQSPVSGASPDRTELMTFIVANTSSFIISLPRQVMLCK